MTSFETSRLPYITVLLASGIGVAACNGAPVAPDSGVDAAADCAGDVEGTPCGPERVCARGRCAVSTCGDGVVDVRMEDCDDANAVPLDGCEPNCRFTCGVDADCQDLEACNGGEICAAHRCVPGTPMADGTSCGGSPGLICLGQRCTPTRCGDGVLDSSSGEQCEDGNMIAGDGCENDCTFTCEAATAAVDCPDDGEECNGLAECDVASHTCGPGAPAADGSACTNAVGAAGTCQGTVCIAAGCGNGILDASEECDDGDADDADGCTRMCTFTCNGDGQCGDGDPCNGAETCTSPGTIESRCQPGVALSCNDGTPCTTDTCAAVGCVFTLIDADGDGHAPSTLGSCGDDCDDANPAVHAGRSETCMDGLDNDCDGTIDNGLTTWFADCDGDGYAAAGAVTVMQCSTPTPSATGCGTSAQRWVTRNPATGPDCNDAIATVHPTAPETVGNERDDNCDGRELCYRNSDGDDYRTSTWIESPNISCRDVGEASASILPGDCCDTDDRAHPGATMYYYGARAGCGGYDYDCNGSAELQLRGGPAACLTVGAFTCSTAGTIPGWVGTATPPPCGSAGRYLFNTASCMPMGGACGAPTVPQACR